MTGSVVSPLPLGRSTFAALRAAGAVYVDKTDLVAELAAEDRKIFLARPRRFGKSLLLSTFGSLFEAGLRDFEGLAISSVWTDRTYDVVRLDFSEVREFSDADDFKKKFSRLLRRSFSRVGVGMSDSDEPAEDRIALWMAGLPVRSLVVLIDEYDAPLTVCLNDAVLFKDVQAVMSEFFSLLKSQEGCLRFLFMTGITKFSSTSIFSAFNNLRDISLDTRYGTLLGYTEEEMQRYFGPHLEQAAEVLQTDTVSLMKELKSYYDGFCFDEAARLHVFCPWSVLNFLTSPARGFKNYWFSSGGQTSVLMKYLENHTLADPVTYLQPKRVTLGDLSEPRRYSSVSLEVLLFQAGYLTIKSADETDSVELGYPNREVAVSMARLYAGELLRGRTIRPESGLSVLSILSSGSPSDVADCFNYALNSIDYQRFPVRDEASCRAYLQVLLIGAAMLPQVEAHTARGRSDLEVDAGGRHWVFELKYAADGESAEKKLSEAVGQMLSRHYGETMHGRTLMRMAFVYSGRERRFVAWKTVREAVSD